MPLTGPFDQLLSVSGSDVLYHRDDSLVPCPCRTKLGYRDPIWHLQHPLAPVCNDAAMLSQPGTTAEFITKAFVQPVQAGAVRRLTSEQLQALFAEIKADDHIGLFPCEWNEHILDFKDWGQATEDWLVYNGRKFTVVSTNLIPDPSDGSPFHHWEVGMRLLGDA